MGSCYISVYHIIFYNSYTFQPPRCFSIYPLHLGKSRGSGLTLSPARLSSMDGRSSPSPYFFAPLSPSGTFICIFVVLHPLESKLLKIRDYITPVPRAMPSTQKQLNSCLLNEHMQKIFPTGRLCPERTGPRLLPVPHSLSLALPPKRTHNEVDESVSGPLCKSSDISPQTMLLCSVYACA